MQDRGFPLRSTVHEHRLENGLTVLIIEDRRSPVAAIVTHVSAGYFDEGDDVVGISHVLEHMFFKGTARRGPGDMGRETRQLGGYLNAGTIYDRTSYYTVVPSSGLEQALDIQSDALLNATIDAGELERELGVIIQEAKRKLDSPPAVARESLFETMFDQHRIRRWRIGTEAGLARLTRDHVVAFYRGMYRAPNTVLCIAGDVDVGPTLALVERLYGGMDGSEPPRDRGPDESERTGFRFRDLEGDVAETYIEMGWRTRGIRHPDAPALDLAALALGNGRASRLYRNVRERGFVTRIGAGTYTPGEIGLFMISAVARPEETAAALDATHGVLAGLRARGVSQAELDRARNKLEAQLVRRFETVEGQAMSLTEWQALGDWRLFREYWDRLMSATTADVDRAAAGYLDPGNATVLVYRPAGSDRVDWAPAPGEEGEGFDGAAGGDEAGFTLTVTDAGTQEASLDTVENGVRLYHGAGSRITLLCRRDVPLVSLAIACRAIPATGSRAGLSGLLARTSIKGTGSRDAERIAVESESLGAAIVPMVTADALQWSITVPSKHVMHALDLLGDVVRNATFPADELERERKAALSAAKLLRDDMSGYPLRLLYEAAFEGDAYGVALETEEEALAGATRADVVDWHARIRGMEPMLLMAGDIEPDIVHRAAAAVGGEATVETPEPEPAPWPDEPRRNRVERDTAQSALAIAFRGPDRNHPDSDVLQVLAAAIAGLGGRLFEELRSRRSLAYTVAARPVARLRAGAFVGYIATSPDREEEARAALIEELMKLTTEPLREDEVERARRYLIGVRQIRRQTNAARLAELAHALLLGTGLEEIDNYEERILAVTPERIRETAARWFDPDRIVEGIVRGSGRAR